MTRLTYRFVAHTDIGLRRSNNQDSGYAGHKLIAMADGMGGAAAGDLASSQVLAIIKELDGEVKGDALQLLGDAVERANDRLGELTREDPAVEGMGTTLEAMLWDGQKLAYAHIGDSRSYRLREGKLTQLSDDHTFVQSLVDEGRITREEARVHPHRSLLLRALLGRDDNAPDLNWLQPAAGDRYLLCSDGLSDLIDDDAIEQAMRGTTIDEIAVDLVNQALEAGGYDNITAVIAEFVHAGLPIDPELSCANGLSQVVGALAEAPQPRTPSAIAAAANEQVIERRDTAGAPTNAMEDSDEEELRYAPRTPSRLQRLSWTMWPLLVVVLFAVAGWFAWSWSQDQYWVGEADGQVAIYRGVEANIGTVNFSTVDQLTGIEISDLENYQQTRVEDGIRATSRDNAVDIVNSLSDESKKKSASTPTPTPSSSASATTPTSKLEPSGTSSTSAATP